MAINDDLHVPRRDLARQLADRLTPDPFSGASAGLFLAAPRRTGKSTFLRRDLMPVLEERGKLTIYVDLWSDRAADPGRLIAAAVAKAAAHHAGLTERVLGALPFDAVSVGGVSVSLGETQRAPATLSDALAELARRARKDVVLIVDEAQHALTSDAGMDAMYALKAARDAINQGNGEGRFWLILTGSHRDKLASLVMTAKAPFYGGTVSDFPTLDRAYVDALVPALNRRLAQDNQLDPEDVMEAFVTLGRQPEKLLIVIREHALGQEGSSGLRRTIRERADVLRARAWEQQESEFDQLDAVQRGVLRAMAQDGADFAPFAASTRERIAAALDRDEVTTTEVQRALEGLRDRQMIWRPSRGVYALETQDMREWLLEKTA